MRQRRENITPPGSRIAGTGSFYGRKKKRCPRYRSRIPAEMEAAITETGSGQERVRVAGEEGEPRFPREKVMGSVCAGGCL